MEEIVQLITNYGVMVIITTLFVWDWITNRKIITKSIEEIATANTNIKGCLENLEKNSENISKSLDLLQKTLESQDRKIDKLLERR